VGVCVGQPARGDWRVPRCCMMVVLQVRGGYSGMEYVGGGHGRGRKVRGEDGGGGKAGMGV
jgi:hypothetical protein